MSDASGFNTLVPGFDFLQSLVKNAGSALPGIGQWVAPTLDPAELEKRIGELKTVQFWLEQNARMLSATIQALEVQRMTLSTLKTMNVQMGDLRETLKIKTPGVFSAAAADAATTSEAPAPPKKKAATRPGDAVDPMQWWGALTSQFTQLATHAMKDSATEAAKGMAANIVRQSFDAATAPARAAVKAATQGGGAKAKPARKRAASSSR
ncbi:MAG: PhaM family polyhydroxyalkanoate granule multifunctional regulatory protein [Caldimonas sp.]